MSEDFWPDQTNKLRDFLGVEHPILQAPMAGGPTTPELVAAVSNTGALGSLGAGYMSPEDIESDIKKIREFTEKPFAVNLFVPAESPSIVPSEKVMKKLGNVSEKVGAEVPHEFPSLKFTFEDQFRVILENRVPVFSFTFGIPEEKYIEKLLAREVAVIGTATSVEEGVRLEEAGCSAVIAQGSEAGGHRASFGMDGEVPMIGSISLVPQLADKVGVPVISSGGIMDGRGIAAALALGASAVQMGTAFLSCKEASLNSAWQDALLKSTDTSTVLTNVFTGKYARGIKNTFIEEFKGLENEIPAYPIQQGLTTPLRAAAKSKGDAEYMSLWAGQGSAMSRKCSAAELIELLVSESREALQRISSKS
ncbi:MAG: nitronate monooxygenase [Deltaproteobacteria bacterium]